MQTKYLYNARIYITTDDPRPVSALAIRDGRVLAAGAHEQLRSEFEGIADWIDLGGRTILPGLIDAHIHLEHYGFALQKINCETPTKAGCLERIRERLQSIPPGRWVLGHGWNQNEWDGGFPSAEELDAISQAHPIYLTAKSLHAAWVNSKALEIAKIRASTADPDGGKIQRNPDGTSTGILFESAMNLVANCIPEATEAERLAAVDAAQQALWRFGITGVHDFDRRGCFIALQQLHEQGRLRLRVHKSLPLEVLDEAIEIGLRSGFGDEWLRIGSIKAFADGALGPRTAAMLKAYEGEPGNTGLLLIDGEGLFEHARKATRHGLSMAVHAIGDRANHEVLNAYASLRNYERENALPLKRHRIEHVQVIHPADAVRLSLDGIIASMQPIHAISDMEMADRYWGERSAFAYAWRTQLDHGARLIFGSDAPVDSPNPFWGLHAALTRQKEGRAAPWYPEQRLAVNDALNAYTSDAAFAAGLENIQGKLEPGYFADLIVLPVDPFGVGIDAIKDIQPLMTMCGGEWVYQQSTTGIG
jgi:predicted amidohydrolase YtcJ